MASIFHIATNGGHSYTGQSREIMAEQFGAIIQALEDVIDEIKKRNEP